MCGACELSLFHFFNFCFDSVRVVTEGGGCLGGVCACKCVHGGYPYHSQAPGRSLSLTCLVIPHPDPHPNPKKKFLNYYTSEGDD